MRKIRFLILIICMLLVCAACSRTEKQQEEPAAVKKPEVTGEPAAVKESEVTGEPAAVKEPEVTGEPEAVKERDRAEEGWKAALEEGRKAKEELSVPVRSFENGCFLNQEGIYCDPDGNPIDLEGMEIVVADWFSEYPAEVSSASEELVEEYHDELRKTYNFNLSCQKLSDYGDYRDKVEELLNSDDGRNYVFCVESSFLTEPILKGQFYDLSQLDILDFSEEKWNQTVKYLSSRGTSVYGMKAGASEPGAGIFLNKRLFELEGLYPELIYDLQEKGEWTWDAFEDVCRFFAENRESSDNYDCWPMVSAFSELMDSAIISNGAKLVGRDDSDNFFLDAGSEKFIEAYNWLSSIRKIYEKPPGSSAQDSRTSAYSAFMNGEAAMLVADVSAAAVLSESMEDDYYFVMFPHGPGVDHNLSYSKDYIYVIPSYYDKDRAWKIALAFNLFSEPAPCFDYDCQEYVWMEAYYPIFCDERAVEETLQLMRTNQKAQLYKLIPNLNEKDDYFLNIDSQSGQERFEEKRDEYQAYIDAVNSAGN